MNGSIHFRRLLRSTKFAFGEDLKALRMARAQLKGEFAKNKHIVDPGVLTTLYKDVDDIDNMLRFHIVQGSRRNGHGSFEVNLKPEHQTTIEAEQDRQYGPELTPVDPSYIGQEVVGMTRVKPAAGCGSKKPFTEDVSQT